MNKALQGVRILDLTHMLAGPYASMILADLGAETIKVEPLKGEGTRSLLAKDPQYSLNGMGAYYLTLNRNKQSIAIDLKHPAGREVFNDLVRESDVVINNFAAGVPQRLGIDYETLAKINPAIITCSVTGFGSDGPHHQRPAFDQVAQAIAGIMSVTGKDADDPVRAGIPIGDLGGGMFAAMGVMAALLERGNSGVGQHVDISMLDCQVSMLNYMATMYFLSGKNPEPVGNAHYAHIPYNTYPTADGFIVIAVITDNFWTNLKKAIVVDAFDNPELDVQPGRFRHRDLIDSELEKVLRQNTTAYWLELLEKHRVPSAPVNQLSDTLSDPQVLHRNMVIELENSEGGSTRGPGNPIKLSRSGEETFSAAPFVGEHTDTVLKEILGYDEENLISLKKEGAVG